MKLRAMLWTLAFTGCVFGAYLGRWISDDQPPVSTVRQRVLNNPVRPGGVLLIEYTVVRHRSCSTVVDRLLFDSRGVRTVLDDLEFKAAPGPLGESTFTTPIPVPKDFAQGQAKYRLNISWRCNPVHQFWPISREGREVLFEVEGAPVEAYELPSVPSPFPPVNITPFSWEEKTPRP